MILLDANILVSAVLGREVKRVLKDMAERGVALGVPEPQFQEAVRVLVKKMGFPRESAVEALRVATQLVLLIAPESYATHEQAARARLHERAQPDWPVLAAALAADGGIWSHDRDFFGVGAPVWSTYNLRFADGR